MTSSVPVNGSTHLDGFQLVEGENVGREGEYSSRPGSFLADQRQVHRNAMFIIETGLLQAPNSG
jgi:hypothetical protein